MLFRSTGKLCPEGWRVSSSVDWNDLQSYMGAHENVGGKMMEEGTTHWLTTGEQVLNSFGFTALPNGMRLGSNGSFFGIREYGNWWTSTPETSSYARYISISSNTSLYNYLTTSKQAGLGVRCVKE